MARVLCILAWTSSWSAFAKERFYKAAFVEHEVVSPCGYGSCGRAQKAASVNAYRTYAAQAAAKGAQIIVFPEYGITGESSQPKPTWVEGGYTETIPDVLGKNPCEEAFEFPHAPSVVTLSCIAKHSNIAIVANLIDYQNGKMYNTDVAFDTDGRLVAKYYKQNLWGEKNIDVPATCSTSTFNVSFGITFGMFTCADLIYEHPAVEMVRNNVEHFVVPVAWSNEMAQLQTMAYAQGWSARHGVNLIVSNLRGGSGSGSGIWSSGRTLASQYMPSLRSGRVVVAEVPMTPQEWHSQHHPSPFLAPEYPLSIAFMHWYGVLMQKSAEKNNQWHFVSLSVGHVCSSAVCCTANLVKGSNSGYVLGALDGFDGEEGIEPFPAQACVVLPCREPSISCLKYRSSNGNLHGLHLAMSGLDSANVVIPEVFATNADGSQQILLTNNSTTDGFQVSQSGVAAELVVASEQRLGSAMLYARQFDRDRLPYSCPSSGSSSVPFQVVTI